MKNKPNPRKHHYVPQFYLGGFTGDGTVKGALNVLDMERLEERQGRPKEVAHRRDFHRINLGPTCNPMFVEEWLGELEGTWSTVLREVIDQQQLPHNDRFGDLMMFVAFMAVRVPRIRDKISEFVEEVRRKEEFGRQWFEKKGRMVEFAYQGTGERVDQTWLVQEMVRKAANLVPWLSRREWQLWVADTDSPDFVCSDSPVSLNWLEPSSNFYPPGFGLKNTVVTIPLQKRMAMVGRFNGNNIPYIVGRDEIALVNSFTCRYAGQVYSADTDFIWLTEDCEFGCRADLLKARQKAMSDDADETASR